MLAAGSGVAGGKANYFPCKTVNALGKFSQLRKFPLCIFIILVRGKLPRISMYPEFVSSW